MLAVVIDEGHPIGVEAPQRPFTLGDLSRSKSGCGRQVMTLGFAVQSTVHKYLLLACAAARTAFARRV